MDETTLSLRPPLRACWMKRGQQKRITLPTQRAHCHLFGAYNWRNDTLTWLFTERQNSEAFIAFLEHLLVDTYPTQEVVLVLDNASFHTSEPALAALSLFEHRLQVFWLPPRSPELNPIERFWRHLKDRACANSLRATLFALRQSIEIVLHLQNSFDYHLRFQLCK